MHPLYYEIRLGIWSTLTHGVDRHWPSLRELTTVPFTGTKTVKIKLTSGQWEFYCRPHESVMQGEFTVK